MLRLLSLSVCLSWATVLLSFTKTAQNGKFGNKKIIHHLRASVFKSEQLSATHNFVWAEEDKAFGTLTYISALCE